jgi:hypothetical protein
VTRVPGALDVVAQAVVTDLEPELVSALPQPDHGARIDTCVLADILETFQTAEVDGRLDVLGVAAGRRRLERRRLSRAPCDAGQGLAKSELAEHRRVQPLREIAQLLQDLLELGAELGESSCGLRVRRRQLACETDPDAQGDEVLLRSVVEVTLDPAALGVSRRDDARARRRSSAKVDWSSVINRPFSMARSSA